VTITFPSIREGEAVRHLTVTAYLTLTLLAFAPPAKPPAPVALAVTKDEQAMLRGLTSRAELVKLRAIRELEAIAAEQREYLGRVAKRLEIPPEKFLTEYTIDLDSAAVTHTGPPRPAAAAK
jgi:hypothetical protein